MKTIELLETLPLIFIMALFINFLFRLAEKWRLWEKWDVYSKVKRCMLCLSWWVSLVFMYLYLNQLSNPFDLDMSKIALTLLCSASSASLTLFFYESNR